MTWLAKFTWNDAKQKIEFDRDFADSMLLNNEMVLSFCQYKPTPCVEVKPKENCLLL